MSMQFIFGLLVGSVFEPTTAILLSVAGIFFMNPELNYSRGIIRPRELVNRLSNIGMSKFVALLESVAVPDEPKAETSGQ